MGVNWPLVAAIALAIVFTVADTPSRRAKVVVLALLAASLALPRLTAWPHARAASAILQAALAVSLIVYLRFHRYIK